MFIVWRKRPVKSNGGGVFLGGDPKWRHSDGGHDWGLLRCEHQAEDRLAWTPLVMVSERVDGKPRQRLLYRLPTIRTCCIADPFNRAAWWYVVRYQMDGWSEWAYQDRAKRELDSDLSRDRKTLLAKLIEFVPLPDRRSVREFAAHVERTKEDKRRLDEELWEHYRESQAREQAEKSDHARRESYEFFGHPRADNVATSFAVFNLPIDTPIETVKAEYRRLVKIHHPDRKGDEATFRSIQKAWEAIEKHHARRQPA